MWKNLISKLTGKQRETQSYATFYENYRNSYVMPSLKTSCVDQRFVVFDTETSGLDPKNAQILSIGAVKVQNMSFEIASSLSIRLKSNVIPTTEAVSIHGLVSSEQTGIEMNEAAGVFFDFIGSDVLVGHHVGFDLAMLNNLSLKHGGGPILNMALDTSMLARRLDNPHDPSSLNPKEYTLDKLCKRFSIIPKARHTADGDAYITALAFIYILHRLQAKGIHSLGQLMK